MVISSEPMAAAFRRRTTIQSTATSTIILLLLSSSCYWIGSAASFASPLAQVLTSPSSSLSARMMRPSSIATIRHTSNHHQHHHRLVRIRGGWAAHTHPSDGSAGAGDSGGSSSSSSNNKPTATTTSSSSNVVAKKLATAAAASSKNNATAPTKIKELALPPPQSKPTSNNNNNNTSLVSVATTLEYNATAVDAGSQPLSQLFAMLQTSPTQGLTSAQAAARLQQYGPNQLAQPPPKSIWSLILEQFQDRLVQILLVVAVLSALFSWAEVQQLAAERAETAAITAATADMLADAADTAVAALWKSFVEPLVILAILILNAAVGVWQSQSAADSLQALQKLQPSLCTVIRDNGSVMANFPAANLVPGDILQIRVGDKVPADARLLSLQSSSLAVDEASLTGESVTVNKLAGDDGTVDSAGKPVQDQRGMLFAGTMVTRGSGQALVVQTGMDTQFGRIQKGVTEAQAPKTPLAVKLDEFGETLTIIIGVICLAVWIVSIPKMNDPTFRNVWEGAIYYAKVAVALGVAAIPEGLPAVITLCLSLGTRRMAERNVIVRKLPSVETLGCTSVICTDKTGTLTTNEMTAVSLVLMEHNTSRRNSTEDVALREHLIEGFSYSPIGKVDGIVPNEEVKEQPLGAVAEIAAVCALCNDAKIVGNDQIDELQDSDGSDQEKKKNKRTSKLKEREKAFGRVGEPTEAALCVLAEKLGGMSHYLEGPGQLDRRGLHYDVPPSVLASANVDSWRKEHPRLATLEFNRDRKSMSVLCEFPMSDYPSPDAFHGGVKPRQAGNRLLVKGAPNLLLERCTHVKFRDGTVAKLSGELRRTIESKLSEMAARPLRCLALAVKDKDQLEKSLQTFSPMEEGDVAKHPLLSNPDNYRNIESGLTLVGIVGIKDPARPEVAASIEECTRAGIRILMITGDARDTAVAIARDVNIFPREDDAAKPIKSFEGREFFLKSSAQQLEILKEGNIVFCRAEPADKQKLVKMLQSLHEITAMTGDGVNDAPALQQASIGLAMGITGTEVSKEAADMILADDNFSTIVNAVEEGRRIYANMQAFICFLISCNIGEICAIFFATLAGFPEPLTAMHLLWVNLVTDGPPATALGFNPPAPDLMDVPPRPSDEPIMTRWLLTRYCITGLYVGLATIGVFAQHYLSQGITLAQLASWSQCGEFWMPPEGVSSCSALFQGPERMLPQTLALTTLVCMEMLKALSAVSVDSSLFQVGPQSNPWLLVGVTGPFLLHLLVVYSSNLGMPALGESFGLVPLSIDNWVSVLSWAAPILLVDEILKAIGRWVNREERRSRVERLSATSRVK